MSALADTVESIRAALPAGAEWDSLRRVVECNCEWEVKKGWTIRWQCPRCLTTFETALTHEFRAESRAVYWEAAEQRDPGVLAGALAYIFSQPGMRQLVAGVPLSTMLEIATDMSDSLAAAQTVLAALKGDTVA